ncbi:hypothetical protein [Clostridium culturomicium]|uniref:hypothetical protein n=1 Tax=Clostridium culturomicium TaxID=1499683 RepID=UPI00385746B4
MNLDVIIDEYLEKCNTIISSQNSFEANNLVGEMLAVFTPIIPRFDQGVDVYYGYGSGNIFDDIKNIIGKLKLCKSINGNYSRFSPASCNSIVNTNSVSDSGNSTNTNTNNNTNTNTVGIKAELSRVREEIESDEVLDDDSKAEIQEKINEIEAVIDENPSNNEKWKKLKGVITWVLTKGYKIGEKILPIVVQVLFTNGQQWPL